MSSRVATAALVYERDWASPCSAYPAGAVQEIGPAPASGMAAAKRNSRLKGASGVMPGEIEIVEVPALDWATTGTASGSAS